MRLSVFFFEGLQPQNIIFMFLFFIKSMHKLTGKKYSRRH